MAKITGLTINKQFGCLEAQQLEFTQDSKTLIEVKGNVGSGKTTLNRACLLTAAGKAAMPDKDAYGKDFDIETQIAMMDGRKVFCRSIRKEGGNIQSTVYLKDAEGNKVKNFMVNDRKVTPAKFLEMLRTELTFNIDKFLSDHDLTHFNFMADLFGHKLKEVGIILNKKDENYQGSILDLLERAKVKRADLEREKKRVDGHKTALEKEGYSELNAPTYQPTDDLKRHIENIRIESQQSRLSAQEAHFKAQAQAQEEYNAKVSKIKEQVAEANAVFSAYNASIESQRQAHEAQNSALTSNINKALESLSSLEALGYKGQEVEAFVNSLPRPTEKEFKLIEYIDGKPKQHDGLPQNCIDAFNKRAQLGREFKLIQKPAQTEFSYQDNSLTKIAQLEEQIKQTESDNLIAERWDAFKAHQKQDKEVKKLQDKYKVKFAEIDFGVPGLCMSLNDDDEIKTYYDGSHDPEYFANSTKEMRLLKSYSLTQKNFIGVLMQVYLLEEKKRMGHDPLYNMWVDFPMDNNTRDLLIGIQEKHGMQLITNTTGDFTEANKDGELIIKNGIILQHGK